MSKVAYVDIVFDGPPGPFGGHFVEVEDDAGYSRNFGEWIKRDDGYWVLRLRPDAWPQHQAPADTHDLSDFGDQGQP